jgi:hypothetical protein
MKPFLQCLIKNKYYLHVRLSRKWVVQGFDKQVKGKGGVKLNLGG